MSSLCVKYQPSSTLPSDRFWWGFLLFLLLLKQSQLLVQRISLEFDNIHVFPHTVGLTATNFKARFRVHKKSFEDPEYCKTTLRKHIHDLKNKVIEQKFTWKILDRAKSYSSVTNVCNKEAYYIIFEPHLAELNSRAEHFSTCIYEKSHLLFKT